MGKKPSLGDIVEVHCEKCRVNLDASVAAMEGDEIKQVQCRTCGEFVRYREPVPESVRKDRVIRRVLAMRERKSQRPTRRRASEPAMPEAPAAPVVPAFDPEERRRWQEVTDGVMSTTATPYVAQRQYHEGDFVLHKAHGMGYVERLEGDESMSVLFRNGTVELPINQPRDNE